MNSAEKVYKQALDYALKKIKKNMGVLKGSFPFATVNGKWELCKEEDWDLNIFKDGYWCNGFWIGILWRAYKLTKKDEFKEKAYELCKLIESRKSSNKIHDLGVLFYPSFCVGYEITKDEYLKSVALTAAGSLLSRFNDTIGAITVSGELDKSGLTAIDTMMNLPLLWWAYDLKLLGRNYRITDFQAALGISQLKKLDELIRRRAEIVKLYNEAFEDIPEIETPVMKPYVKPAWHIYTVLLNGMDRDDFFSKMRERNIGVNVHYIPIYRFSYYQEQFNINPSDFPVTEEVFSKIVTLPLFSKMTEDEVLNVIEIVKESIIGQKDLI